MAIRHAISGEPVDVRPLGARLAGSESVALFKSDDLEVIRLVLPRGKSLPAHRVDGGITIQCIEGRIDLVADGRSVSLAAGTLVFLAGGVEHSVSATEDSSALLTIALRR
jgi:quercetin dioxygenase-like cupin family protein